MNNTTKGILVFGISIFFLVLGSIFTLHLIENRLGIDICTDENSCVVNRTDYTNGAIVDVHPGISSYIPVIGLIIIWGIVLILTLHLINQSKNHSSIAAAKNKSKEVIQT